MRRLSRRELLGTASLGGLALFEAGCGLSGTAPPFETTTQFGRTIRLSDFRGKPLLLTFWATWCPYCRGQMAEMQKMSTGYSASSVALVALSVDQNGWDVVRPYVTQNGISFPVGLASRSIVRSYGASGGIPVTFAISPTGVLVGRQVGGLDQEWLQQMAADAAGKA